MTTTTSPKAEELAKENKTKEEEAKKVLSSILEKLEKISNLYTSNKEKTDELIKSKEGVSTGPWKTFDAANSVPGQSHIFKYLFEEPIKSTYKSKIKNYIDIDYTNTFDNGLQKINGEGGLKELVTSSQTELDSFNITKYKNDINLAKEITSNYLIFYAEIYKDILETISNEINNSQSIIYKTTTNNTIYGPFSIQEVNNFALPPKLFEIKDTTDTILAELRSLFNELDQISNLSEDVLTRIGLTNLGLTQSSSDPNIYNTLDIEEKDPWGIRFSYTSSTTGQLFAEQQTGLTKERANRTLTHDNQTREEVSFIEGSQSLDSITVAQKRNFYFQLLPAIKSNLPISGATDVPGAMPGIQFRIENNIVKHRIPGFAPIYQPMGIESIKCTLVGMFTGNDGVDISSTYSDDISAGLIPKGEYLKNMDISSDTTTKNNGSDTAIPAASKSNTASNIAVLSEDAFRGAQDFYNEVVAAGREIEVELNLRKASGPVPGGTPGPFRDETTGNPKFKALIKRLDLYYVRRDRCWFILDLEITNSGLISDKCINLTNIIEEATELFESTPDAPVGLTKEELDKCFINPIEYKYTGEKSGTSLMFDKSTGLSYEFNNTNNTLTPGNIYPTSLPDTIATIKRDIKNLKIPNFGPKNKKQVFIEQLYKILTNDNNVQSIKKNASDPSLSFFPNKLPGRTVVTVNAYNKNDGLFYLQYKSNSELFLIKGKPVKKTLKQLLDDGDIAENDSQQDEILNFLLNDYLPLLTLKPNNCNKDQVAQTKKNTPPSNNESNTAPINNQDDSNSVNVNAGFDGQGNPLQEDKIINVNTNASSKEQKQELKESFKGEETKFNTERWKEKIQDGLEQALIILQTGDSPLTTRLTNRYAQALKQSYNRRTLYIKETAPTIHPRYFTDISNKIIEKKSSDSNIKITFNYSIRGKYTLISKSLNKVKEYSFKDYDNFFYINKAEINLIQFKDSSNNKYILIDGITFL